MLHLALWFVTDWRRRSEMLMRAAVNVMVFYEDRGREMVMCAAVSVMVCYWMRKKEGYVDVCCS